MVQCYVYLIAFAVLCLVAALVTSIVERARERKRWREFDKDLPAFLRKQAD